MRSKEQFGSLSHVQVLALHKKNNTNCGKWSAATTRRRQAMPPFTSIYKNETELEAGGRWARSLRT